ncbi:MAG: hypothetical protein L0H83_15965 [Salinisphaera sp.]|nr:hypothetical protein [Salinisphaera sp.]
MPAAAAGHASTAARFPEHVSEPDRQTLLSWARECHLHQRPPDFTLGSPGQPYLQRWYVLRNGQDWLELPAPERARVLREENPREDRRGSGGNLFIHCFVQSDDARALHDHPWDWETTLLHGSYYEHQPADPLVPHGATQRLLRTPGRIIRRAAGACHRIELVGGAPVIT